ncbi:polysaccharide pyruvyl transferase family protein [Arthrobacter bambusae]|uniref:polysaccharide pyruvyl transferase family protein n=1 Tax=Arthrobacter bambusae TaxID=1338426 RepID=UPI00277E903D|nr:polysaccharide pyruvyl transferase family protein [Arthrobacter bambusae]MDQ0029214.1 polysaccharide pyruvyl transferase WcaK-like protein [Arthrobacter bambusae]MDQ0098123.1 polysaccharide pyruvyl transferase WcaK-like protein [Arthrobacter bambusae]
MLKILVQGDLGQVAYHVGDEAMAIAAADELRARLHAGIVLLTRDPEQTRELYGMDAIDTLVFPWPPAERSRHLELVRRAARGDRTALAAEDSVWRVIDEVKSADGVLIAGGGNMNSLYGWLLYERAALGLIAKELGKPLVVSGQTFGPTLLPQDQHILHELLDYAALVGAREPSSYALGFQMGLDSGKLTRVLDDASFLAPHGPADVKGPGAEEFEFPTGPYIAATFGPESWRDGTRSLAKLGEVLDRAVELTGLPVYLVPHVGPLGQDGQGGDHESHETVLAHSRSGRIRLCPVLPAPAAAALTVGAELVLTNRYHPVVFGLAAGVPVVALANDFYSDVRLHGAMDNWGVQDWALPLSSLDIGGFDLAIAEAWARRTEFREHLESLRPRIRAVHENWWDAVASIFSAAGAEAAKGLEDVVTLGSDSEWAKQAKGQRLQFRALSGGIARLWTEWDDVRSQRDLLLHERNEALDERERIVQSRSFKAASVLRKGASVLRRVSGGRR